MTFINGKFMDDYATSDELKKKKIKALQAWASEHQNSLLLSTGFHKRLFKTFCKLLLSYLLTRYFFQPKSMNIFSFLHENICCGTH